MPLLDEYEPPPGNSSLSLSPPDLSTLFHLRPPSTRYVLRHDLPSAFPNKISIRSLEEFHCHLPFLKNSGRNLDLKRNWLCYLFEYLDGSF